MKMDQIRFQRGQEHTKVRTDDVAKVAHLIGDFDWFLHLSYETNDVSSKNLLCAIANQAYLDAHRILNEKLRMITKDQAELIVKSNDFKTSVGIRVAIHLVKPFIVVEGL